MPLKIIHFICYLFPGSFHDNILAESKRTILVPPVLLVRSFICLAWPKVGISSNELYGIWYSVPVPNVPKVQMECISKTISFNFQTSWQDAFVICHSFDYEVISFLTQDDIKSFNQYVIDHGKCIWERKWEFCGNSIHLFPSSSFSSSPAWKKGLTNSTFWTDFRRIGGTWISQEKGYGMGETNWASGQPDNAGGNQGCVSINPAAQKWYDNNCANMYSVACVKDENKCCNKIDPCKKPC